jgi:hypothetical protein
MSEQQKPLALVVGAVPAWVMLSWIDLPRVDIRPSAMLGTRAKA